MCEVTQNNFRIFDYGRGDGLSPFKRITRANYAVLSVAALFLGSCTLTPPIDTKVRLEEGSTVDIPFVLAGTGTYDIQLQYSRDAASDRIEQQLQRELAGTATLRAGDKKLQWQLPTGWFRVSPFNEAESGMVLTRFRGYANTRYVLTLQIARLPQELKAVEGVVSVYQVPSRFHPGHRVYELQ